MSCEDDKAEALQAYKDILLGKQVSSTTYNGHTTAWAVGGSQTEKLKAIKQYLQSLPCTTDDELVAAGVVVERRAARFHYGGC